MLKGLAMAGRVEDWLFSPLTARIEEEIAPRSESLRHDMEMCEVARQAGDGEAVAAYEFRMRETYSELLPWVMVRGLVSLMPHLLVLCGLYYFLPRVSVGGVGVSTVSAYIVVVISLKLISLLRAWRRRGASAKKGEPRQ